MDACGSGHGVGCLEETMPVDGLDPIRNVFSHVSAGKLRKVALMLNAILAQGDLPTARGKAAEVAAGA